MGYLCLGLLPDGARVQGGGPGQLPSCCPRTRLQHSSLEGMEAKGRELGARVRAQCWDPYWGSDTEAEVLLLQVLRCVRAYLFASSREPALTATSTGPFPSPWSPSGSGLWLSTPKLGPHPCLPAREHLRTDLGPLLQDWPFPC